MGWGGRTAGLRRQRHHAAGNAAGNATTRQATQQTTPPHDRQRNRQRNRQRSKDKKGNTKWGGAAEGCAPPFCSAAGGRALFYLCRVVCCVVCCVSVLPVALPVVWWRCLLRCLPRGGVACRVAESVVALPAKAGRPPTPPQQVSQVVPSLFRKNRLFKIAKGAFLRKTQK